MSQHTPGPWQSEPTHDGIRIYKANATVALAVGSAATINAPLIAAAPDLLFALQDIITEYDAVKTRGVQMIPADLADSIRVLGKQALAKATNAPSNQKGNRG